MIMIRQKDWFIPSTDTDDKSILKSDWARGTPGHILIFDANFPCGLSPFKETKILISSFPVILLIKEFYNLSYNWPHRIKISSLRCYLPLMTNFMQKKITISVILSREIDNQRIMQSSWKRYLTRHIRPKVVVSDAIFPLWLTLCIEKKDINWFFPEILLIKNPVIWLEKKHTWPYSVKSGSLRYFVLLMNIFM